MNDIERLSPNSARATRAYSMQPDELMKIIEEAIDSLPQWTLEGSGEARAVRESRLFKFKDDVTFSVSASSTGSEVVFESGSRVGKSDMGQNVRNLRDLTEAVDRRLG